MSRPSITEREKDYVNDALNKGDIGVGEYIGFFESAWASYNKMEYGVSCNSGTNAIYLALKALGIGPGDEVILPEYTMVATAWAVTYTGATPVFVDCIDNLLMDNYKIHEKMTDNTKAIITVPIYGRKTDRIEAKGVNKSEDGKTIYFEPRKIPIIEDMAEAHGIKPQGDIACYSFYGNKILTTGEGGMCLTNNKEYADEMRKYANMYFDKGRTMIHPKVGHNFRMTNLQAAVGLAQTLRIEEILDKRREIESWYDEYLPEHIKMPPREVLWMYDIQTDHQEELKAYLERHDIPTRYGFKPMSMQPMYSSKKCSIHEEIMPKSTGWYGEKWECATCLQEGVQPNGGNAGYRHLNAYKWSKRILYLPTYTDLTKDEVKKICQVIQRFEKK